MADAATQTSALPTKYNNLLRVAAIGLQTPQTLLLEPTTTDSVVQDFVAQTAEQARFIVRSAYSDEDGAGQSYAGHFWSSAAVSATQLADTIMQAWSENRKIQQQINKDSDVSGQIYLMLQAYIEHDIGGVLFAPWSFFPDYACVEYSLGGVQHVVNGAAEIETETAIIALADSEAPLPPGPEAAFLLAELQAACRALRTEFAGAIDCEWAWSAQEQQLVILQVRPQTHAIGPVLALPEQESATSTLPVGDWQYTALSESLGRLSPLSFSLLQQLYRDLSPVLQRIGCVAQDSDFLSRMPDGTVLIAVTKEQQFYTPTRFGGFWRGFCGEQMRQQAIRDFNAVDNSEAFSYLLLSKVFNGWMLSNVLSDGAGRQQKPAPHAYELSWFDATSTETKRPAVHSDSQWSELNVQGRHAFMAELNKLKRELNAHPQQVFCSWQDYQTNAYSAAGLLVEQQSLAAQAIYDYAGVVHAAGVNSAGSSRDRLSLAANHVVTGKAFVVLQPGQHHGELPAGCILIAPYFDNRWVAAISSLQGIVVQRGSHLAHSVLVAREAGVPYCVFPGLDIAGVEVGAAFTLDPLRKVLTQAL